jgi:DNA-directed RNA polymerase subunit RPC12/RpoP
MAILIYDCDHCGITYVKPNNDEHDVEVCEVCGRALIYKGVQVDKRLCNVRTLDD